MYYFSLDNVLVSQSHDFRGYCDKKQVPRKINMEPEMKVQSDFKVGERVTCSIGAHGTLVDSCGYLRIK